MLSNSCRPRRWGVLLLAPLLLLSGCMKFNASYDIKDEEHVNANITTVSYTHLTLPTKLL